MSTEKAVNNFYAWELRGRGYCLYPYPVEIEPPYRLYVPFIDSNNDYIDDGKSPTIFQRLFPKKQIEAKEEFEDEEIEPKYCNYNPDLKEIKISFPLTFDFKKANTIEFLNLLSESNDRLSFEIIGNSDSLSLQIVCDPGDYIRILNLLHAYFPEVIINSRDIGQLPFDPEKEILIADFGYNEEFMRPLNTSIDSLIGIMAVLNNLRQDETVLLQIIFKGVNNPWAFSIINSVGMGKESFFPYSPEMSVCAKEKVSSPLFTVVLRLAVQTHNSFNAERLANELILNIISSSRSDFNSLIPLNNEGYEYESHLENVTQRGTNRLGMIMNSQELSSFIHFPYSPKLIDSREKTKAIPDILIGNKYFIGINYHNGIEKKVTLNDEQRLRHTHIIGATGTGKSTFISNLFLEDVKHGNGCAIFDPHGDTIDEIMPHIPENRLKDVILFDPSDNEYSMGFNLLRADNETEKIVLSSDLVGAFKRHSTAWGDQMTSVLSNAINAFLESNRGGTLLDLKRFILENSYRKEFLKSVSDTSIKYYWENDFALLKRGNLSPLLTRLDTFLRPKTIRYILSQKEGLDFDKVINGKGILLVKLSQGLIGEENSYLLGTLILSKIYQVAQARQILSPKDRLPFYIYLDEFQNFITPSINSILSGARKYGIGLILAHQELNQIKDLEIGNSVLSNSNIRICFRLGDVDAKKLEGGFSFFDNNDLQNLNIGDAIARVQRNTNDFSLKTYPLLKIPENNNYTVIVENSRKYSMRISDLEPGIDRSNIPEQEETPKKEEPIKSTETEIRGKAEVYLDSLKEKEKIQEHRYLQTYIKKIAEQREFKATIEEVIENGRVDVSLVRNENKIACEIAVANSVEYEVKNIQKCLNAGYSFVCVVSKDENHLTSIREKSKNEVQDQNKVKFFSPNQTIEFLDTFNQVEEKEVKRIKGYRVKLNYITPEMS